MTTTTTTGTMESRKYAVCDGVKPQKVVRVIGLFATDQDWRDAAAQVARALHGITADASFGAEQVVRIFPWWVS